MSKNKLHDSICNLDGALLFHKLNFEAVKHCAVFEQSDRTVGDRRL